MGKAYDINTFMYVKPAVNVYSNTCIDIMLKKDMLGFLFLFVCFFLFFFKSNFIKCYGCMILPNSNLWQYNCTCKYAHNVQIILLVIFVLDNHGAIVSTWM